jgi:hypothetical protein
MTDGSAGGRLRFAVIVTAGFVAVTVPRLLLHELWRDEAWLWIVATRSLSVSELFGPLSRSGEGYLFPVLCFLIARLSTSPVAMQGLQLVLAASAVFVFARWAPGSRWERAIFVLGYFPFYEYAAISRHYAAGVLLIWIGCAAARSRRPALPFGAALGLLCQTTVYGYLVAIALAAGWWIDRRIRSARGDEIVAISRGEGAAGVVLALAGAVAGIVQLVPSPGTSFAPGWRVGWDAVHAAKVLATPWRAFVPLPRFELHFWNTQLLDAWPRVEAIGGVSTWVLAATLLWRQKAALVSFALGGLGLAAFSYLKLTGELRHQGHWWLLFMAALWIGGGATFRARSWRAYVFRALLIVQCAAGAFASWMDLRHPFSNGLATAELIRRDGLDRYPLFGHREPPAATVALGLGEPLYSPSRRRFVMYPDWGPEQRELADPEVRCAARDLARREGRDIVLVMNRPLSGWAELDPAGSRTGAIVATEDYYVYRLRRDRLIATAEAAGCEVRGQVLR